MRDNVVSDAGWDKMRCGLSSFVRGDLGYRTCAGLMSDVALRYEYLKLRSMTITQLWYLYNLCH